MFEGLVHRFSLHPKKLFLIDALGAILSVFLLGVILVKLENVFGIPKTTLYFLAFLPCLFVVYDLYCWIRIERSVGVFLKVIAFVNLLYCCISLGMAILHYQKITYMGWGYILLEILIVTSLVIIELKTANKLRIIN
jgi:hypothetical protein